MFVIYFCIFGNLEAAGSITEKYENSISLHGNIMLFLASLVLLSP
jgi:hypothetical protein